MGLRWLNGHALTSDSGKKQRVIVEFAIENAQVVARRKENEEKARVRSKEVVAARERGEKVPTDKKLSKDTMMAKTRKGMKGKKGRPEMKRSGKSFDKVVVGGGGEKKASDGKEEKKVVRRETGAEEGDGEKQKRKAQIIQKKRMARRNRKG